MERYIIINCIIIIIIIIIMWDIIYCIISVCITLSPHRQKNGEKINREMGREMETNRTWEKERSKDMWQSVRSVEYKRYIIVSVSKIFKPSWSSCLAGMMPGESSNSMQFSWFPSTPPRRTHISDFVTPGKFLLFAIFLPVRW